MSSNSLTITDNRTGKSYELPIEDETIRATDLRKIKENETDFGLMPYDPAYMNTASCKSTVTFIDGDIGILEYRGFPIADLAENCTFPEVGLLVLDGKLPTPAALASWEADLAKHFYLSDPIKGLISSFPAGSHPMAVFIAAMAGLSAAYPEAKNISDGANRRKQIMRLFAKAPLIGAYSFRHLTGQAPIDPDPKLSYAGNFLRMLFAKPGEEFVVNPVLERALDVLFILHADHEQNCSTSTMRMVGSAHSDPFSSAAAAAAALYGPLHGGANEAVLKMLTEIGSTDHIPAFIESVKAGKGRLMGFGHRVYKNYDPRARIIKQTAEEVFGVTGKNPLIDIAVELERIALSDEYFIKRKLYPNVDFYSGIIYQAMGFSPEFFTVMFAIGRTIGWLSQWEEMLNDGDQKIARPRQIYLGGRELKFIPKSDR
jgi:citrate synthase